MYIVVFALLESVLTLDSFDQSDFLANLSKDIDANSELRMVTDY